jgi:hypothetical protein
MREAGLKKRPPAEKVAARSVSIIAERDRLEEKSLCDLDFAISLGDFLSV